MNLTDEQLRDKIRNALRKHYPASLTELGRCLGWNKISGSQTQRIRTMLPGLEELLKGNRAVKELDKDLSTTPNEKIATSPVKKSKYPRHRQNPYRAKSGSGYGLCFDILASHEQGLRRDQLVKLYAKESGKRIGNGTWDVNIVCSPNQDGSGHKSSKGDYWVEKGDGGFLKLHLRNGDSEKGRTTCPVTKPNQL